MFPEIKNFSKPQDQHKNKNVNDLKYGEWLWFHPSALNLIRHGSLWIGILIQLIIMTFLFIKGIYFAMIFCLIIIAILSYAIKNQIETWPYYKNMTLYDIFIRDYDGNIEIEVEEEENARVKEEIKHEQN